MEKSIFKFIQIPYRMPVACQNKIFVIRA